MFSISDIYCIGDDWNIFRAICLVCMVCVLKNTQTILSKKPFTWLGKMSMNIYLLHMTVLYMITCRMANVLSLSLMDVSVMFIITLVVTIVLAYVYTKFVEVNLNVAVDKILEKL